MGDPLKAELAGIQATLDASLQREREANERIATLREMLQRAKDEAEGLASARFTVLRVALKQERDEIAALANWHLNNAEKFTGEPVRLNGYRDACADIETAIRNRGNE